MSSFQAYLSHLLSCFSCVRRLLSWDRSRSLSVQVGGVVTTVLLLSLSASIGLSQTPAFEGRWTGQGTAWENGNSVRVRCQLVVAPLDNRCQQFAFRCGTAAGMETFGFILDLHSDGQAFVSGTVGSHDEQASGTLSGRWNTDAVRLSGEQEGEPVRLVMEDITASSLKLSVQRETTAAIETLVVEFQRR